MIKSRFTTAIALSLLIGSVLVAPAQASGPTVTVGPINSTTNSASNFDIDGKWIGDGAVSVPITFSGFDSISSLYVTLNAPDGGAITIDSTGIGASIQRAFGYPRWTNMASISFFGSRSEIATLLASKVTYTPPSDGGTYDVEATITEYSSDVYFNPENGRYYRPVTLGSNISWTSAKAAASGSSYNGLTGYLATITTRSENDFIKNYVGIQNIWIGATDKDSEGTWKWDTGPEAGTTFWTGKGSSGSIPAGKFAYWLKNEPNDSSSVEDYAVTNFTELNGRWNDFSNTYAIKSYLVEYGGIGTFTGTRGIGSASVTTSNPFEIGTVSGNTFTAGDIVWASNTTKSFAINVSRFANATSANFTATLTLNGANMGTLTMPTTTGLTLNTGFTDWVEETSIGFTGSKANVLAALKDLRWNTPSTRKDLEVEIALGETDTDFYLNPSNGHYYKLIQNGSNISWDFAKSLAGSVSYKGMQGYLVTLTTSAENDFIKSKIPGTNVWIGASDYESYVNDKSMIQRDGTEGYWTWVTGPESGTQFWQGAANGSTKTGQYSSWRTNEPNNSSDACGFLQSCKWRDEDYAYTNASGALGLWNDVYAGSGVTRYIIEFGGNPGEVSTAKSAVDVVGMGRVPDAPTNVTAAKDTVNGVDTLRRADISWTAPAQDGNRQITSYTVTTYDATNDSIISGATCTATSPATSCSVTGIMNSSVKFRVTSTNSVGTSSLSSPSLTFAVPNAGEPSQPLNIKAAVSGATGGAAGTVSVSWDLPTDQGTTDITSYIVTASPGGATCTASAPSRTCSTFSATLDPSTQYTFTVVAKNSSATPSQSSSSSVAVTPNVNTDLPTAPTNLDVVITTPGEATVSWTAPSSNGSSSLSTYTITSSPENKTCTATPPATSCTVTGLNPNTNYTFSATASNGNGTSASSTSSVSVNAGTVTSVPSAPTGIQASVPNTGTVTVKFDPPSFIGTSPIDSYLVTAYKPDGTVANTCTTTTTSCNFTSGLTSGTEYKFDVAAQNGNGSSAASAQSVPVRNDQVTSAPSSPTDVKVAVNSDGTATVSFTAPTNSGTTSIVDYTATAYDSNNNAIADASCTTTTTTCTISGIPSGTNFTVKVTAGNSNADSAPSTASAVSNSSTVTSPPGAPTNILASVGANDNVTVSFTPGTGNATSYVVTATNSSDIAVATCTATAPATSCSFPGGQNAQLTNTENYTFSVVATNQYGSSSASDESVAVTPNTPTSAPSAPRNPVASVVSSGVVSVTFEVPSTTGSSALAFYIVTAYDENGNEAGSCTAQAPATSCQISGLSSSVSYSFGVVAANGNDKSGQSTRTSSLRPAVSSGSSGSGNSSSTSSGASQTQTRGNNRSSNLNAAPRVSPTPKPSESTIVKNGPYVSASPVLPGLGFLLRGQGSSTISNPSSTQSPSSSGAIGNLNSGNVNIPANTTFDSGTGPRSLTNQNAASATNEIGKNTKTLTEFSNETLSGFAGSASPVRIEALGVRSAAKFEISNSAKVNPEELISAIKNSLTEQNTNFFTVDSVQSTTAPTVPNKWSSDEQQVLNNYFAAAGLANPISLADVDYNQVFNWVGVSATASSYVPGSTVYLIVTSTPLILASAQIGADGTAKLSGALPVEHLNSGDHQIRLLGTRSLTGTGFDENGELIITDALTSELEQFDSNTQSTVSIAGQNKDGGPHVAIRVVEINPQGSSWTLYLMIAIALVLVFAYYRRKRNLTGTHSKNKH